MKYPTSAISLITAKDVLQLAVDVAAATQELSNLASFAPAAIAAGILLQVFKTIQVSFRTSGPGKLQANVVRRTADTDQ